MISNGSRPHVVIPRVFDGQAGRQGDRIAFFTRSNRPLVGMPVMVDGAGFQIASVKKLDEMPSGWWSIEIAK